LHFWVTITTANYRIAIYTFALHFQMTFKFVIKIND
jgi:hypothetical protein